MPIIVDMTDIEVVTPTMEDDEIAVTQPTLTDIDVIPAGGDS